MDNFVYNAVDRYFHTLETMGYVSHKKVRSLIVLIFYYNLINYDYRGYISKDDYHTIEEALNCLYGTNCLIPYPDYLKMGKLKLGEMTEVLSRTKAVEDYNKVLDQRILDNDALIEDNILRLDEHGTRLDDHDKHFAAHDGHLQRHDEHLQLHDEQIANHEERVQAIEYTRVVKGKNHITDIPDIDLSQFDLNNN